MSYSASSYQMTKHCLVIINTRPVERAAPLTQCLQAAGFKVVDMPLLELQPRSVSNKDIDLMYRWLMGGYKALVVISPAAAIFGLTMWENLEEEILIDNDKMFLETNLKISINNGTHSNIIAVGNATAAILLKDARVKAHNCQVLQPAISSNEGMLAMLEIQQLKAGDKILVWRGLGGRRLLVDTLKANNVHIDSIAWYENIMPRSANTSYQQWLKQFKIHSVTSAEQLKPIVIISSGAAFKRWTSIVNQTQLFNSEALVYKDKVAPLKLTDFTYVVLGLRLAKMIAKQQLSYRHVKDLAPETVVAAINMLSLSSDKKKAMI